METIPTSEVLEDYKRFIPKGSYNFGGELYLSKNHKKLIKITYNSYKCLLYFQKLQIRNGVTFPNQIYELTEYPQTAYEMDFYRNSKTMKKTISSRFQMKEEQKKAIMYQLFQTLEQLHKHIVLGDIHLDNLLIWQNQGIICDWDCYRKLDENSSIESLYYLYKEKIKQNALTDTIKLVISLLSFYFHENFEKPFSTEDNALETLFDTLQEKYPSLKPIFFQLMEEYTQEKEFSSLTASKFIEGLPNNYKK